VAAPGPLDPVSGAIIATPNLEGFEGYPLRERLVAALGLPVLVQNDATLAALGEHLHGAGRGSHLMLYLTVSTGVGGGVVRNGTLETGVHGLGAEFGHIVVADGGRACSFGHRGCLEGLASGTAIALAAREAIASGASTSLGPPAEHPTAREVARAAEHGDELALAIMASAGHYLGVAVGSLVNAFDPDLVVVGGGVAASWPLLAEAVRRAATEVVMCRDLDVEGTSVPGAVLAELTQEGSGLRSGDTGPGAATASGPLVRVTRALTGDDAGLLGAAAWALAQS
jgi:glucokinase